MTTFQEVSKVWALQKLTEQGIGDVQEIDNIDFDIKHDCCYGHNEHDYCECDTSVNVEVLVGYIGLGPRGGKVRRHARITGHWYGWNLGSLIREMIEFEKA